MNVLVTAGNSLVFLDRVRCLTSIFTGRTGAAIALEAYRRGHCVTLLTSHPEDIDAKLRDIAPRTDRWNVVPYVTFDELRGLMTHSVRDGRFDAIIHSAAVSDYLSAGVYTPAAGTKFESTTWRNSAGGEPAMIDRGAGKIKSDEPELWLRLVRAPKLVDMVYSDWRYANILVKFKLEVGLSEAELIDIAEKSRLHSGADLMVANTLEGAADWALIGAAAGNYERITRRELPDTLMAMIEKLHKVRTDG